MLSTKHMFTHASQNMREQRRREYKSHVRVRRVHCKSWFHILHHLRQRRQWLLHSYVIYLSLSLTLCWQCTLHVVGQSTMFTLIHPCQRRRVQTKTAVIQKSHAGLGTQQKLVPRLVQLAPTTGLSAAFVCYLSVCCLCCCFECCVFTINSMSFVNKHVHTCIHE